MTAKERAKKVAIEYGYPDLPKLKILVEEAIIAAEEAKAKEEQERCLQIIGELMMPTDAKEDVLNRIRARLEG